jgi:hypothetical protein
MANNYVCTVSEAGPNTQGSGPVVMLLLTDTGGAFPATWFVAAANARDQMLAVGLAAISTQSQVNVWADPPAGGSPTKVYNLYLMS